MSPRHDSKSTPIRDAVARMLRELDPEPGREGLRDTPARVEKAFLAYTAGYAQDPKQVIGDALFEAETDEMVVVRNIEQIGRAHV